MYWTKQACHGVHGRSLQPEGRDGCCWPSASGIIRQGLDTEILVNNCGTIDLCDCGPNIVVYPDNVIYNGVTVKDIPEIVEHLKGGPVVDRLVLGPHSEREQARKAFYVAASRLATCSNLNELVRLRSSMDSMRLGSQSSYGEGSWRKSRNPRVARSECR